MTGYAAWARFRVSVVADVLAGRLSTPAAVADALEAYQREHPNPYQDPLEIYHLRAAGASWAAARAAIVSSRGGCLQ